MGANVFDSVATPAVKSFMRTILPGGDSSSRAPRGQEARPSVAQPVPGRRPLTSPPLVADSGCAVDSTPRIPRFVTVRGPARGRRDARAQTGGDQWVGSGTPGWLRTWPLSERS